MRTLICPPSLTAEQSPLQSGTSYHVHAAQAAAGLLLPLLCGCAAAGPHDSPGPDPCLALATILLRSCQTALDQSSPTHSHMQRMLQRTAWALGQTQAPWVEPAAMQALLLCQALAQQPGASALLAAADVLPAVLHVARLLLGREASGAHCNMRCNPCTELSCCVHADEAVELPGGGGPAKTAAMIGHDAWLTVACSGPASYAQCAGTPELAKWRCCPSHAEGGGRRRDPYANRRDSWCRLASR